MSWEASDTLLEGCDPVHDPRRKGDSPFRDALRELFSGEPPPERGV